MDQSGEPPFTPFDPLRRFPGNYRSTVEAIECLEAYLYRSRDADWRRSLKDDLAEAARASGIDAAAIPAYEAWWGGLVDALPADLDDDLDLSLADLEGGLPSSFHPVVAVSLLYEDSLERYRLEWWIKDGNSRQSRRSTRDPSSAPPGDLSRSVRRRSRAADLMDDALASGDKGKGRAFTPVRESTSPVRQPAASTSAVRLPDAVAPSKPPRTSQRVQEKSVAALLSGFAAPAAGGLRAGSAPAATSTSRMHFSSHKGPRAEQRLSPLLSREPTPPLGARPPLGEVSLPAAPFGAGASGYPSLAALRDQRDAADAASSTYADGISRLLAEIEPSRLVADLPEHVRAYLAGLADKKARFADKRGGKLGLESAWINIASSLPIDIIDVRKIGFGEFVDFRDLRDYLPRSTHDAPESLQDYAEGAAEKQRKRSPEPIDPVQWLRFWSLFKQVLLIVHYDVGFHRERKEDLDYYGAFISSEIERAADTRTRARIVAYDAFVRMELARPHMDSYIRNWRDVNRNEASFITSVLSPAQSNRRESVDARRRSTSPRAKKPRYAHNDRCGKWNEGRGCDGCNRAHICMDCGGQHQAIKCPRSGKGASRDGARARGAGGGESGAAVGAGGA